MYAGGRQVLIKRRCQGKRVCCHSLFPYHGEADGRLLVVQMLFSKKLSTLPILGL